MNKFGSSIFKEKVSESGNNREFLDGSIRSHSILKSCAIGLGKYKPGWKLSAHAGAQTGKPSENHVGYILEGRILIRDVNGNELEVGPGEAFEIGAGGDAWVIGNETCIALDFIPLKH